jgi:hypothetical protein
MEEHPPRQIFEKLVNKNAIKRKIGGPPWHFFLKPLTPPRDFGKKLQVPPPPWIFNPCAYMYLPYTDCAMKRPNTRALLNLSVVFFQMKIHRYISISNGRKRMEINSLKPVFG